MDGSIVTPAQSRHSTWLVICIFAACLLFHFWGVSVGWQSKNLPGGEFRQAQTALSTYWIKADRDFSLAYPTPVVGKPWSIPMEFPLYQWTVVLTGDITGWGLTKAGRAVSIACFYLTLPAVFLILGRWQVRPHLRLVVLCLLLTCPLYIFYVRGFLIETMALMFSVWFWAGFIRAVVNRSRWWLLVAVIAGVGAGLVKVTTFMLYLFPVCIEASVHLWKARKGEWPTDLKWMFAGVVVPFGATLCWLHFADATKALNPLGVSFTSGSLKEFNFGTLALRLSPEVWLQQFKILQAELTSWHAMGACGLIALFAGWGRMKHILMCVASFLIVLLVFPVLYSHHDYYYVANTLLLAMAMGLALISLAESRHPRWLFNLVLLSVLMGQGLYYVGHYFPGQRAISPGGDGLTRSLQSLTNPRDVILVLGQDWSSITPYYAQRRAIMFRGSVAEDPDLVERALSNLDDEKIGALVIVGENNGEQWLIDRASVRGLSREPIYLWRDARVFLPKARTLELTNTLLESNFHEVRLAPGVELPHDDLSNRWVEMSNVRKWQRQPFIGFDPQPVRFFTTFGPNMDGSSGHPLYGAHPVTRLVFKLNAGRHVLRSALQMPVDAYRLDLSDGETTDGVDVRLSFLDPSGSARELGARYFNPRAVIGDRGQMRPLEFEFNLEQAGEVELFFGAGPAGRDTRDWIQLGPLKIESIR